jgi:hypothetical protein
MKIRNLYYYLLQFSFLVIGVWGQTDNSTSATTVQWNSNSSTCETMKNNGTIEIDCFNATACCFYEYTYNSKRFVQCEKKKNMTDNMCKYLPDVVIYFGGSMVICDCKGTITDSLNILFIIIITIYLL